MSLPTPEPVELDCVCAHKNPACTQCDGSGIVRRPACRLCRGKGTVGGARCLDCRGRRYREIDLSGWSDREL